MSSEPSLPSVDELLAVSKAIAMLDAVLMPEWQYRYYSFDSNWGPGEQMASMRDGCGNGYFILFNRHGAILKGYDHEAAAAEHVVRHGVPLPGMFDEVPEEFASFLREPAFSINETTFCRWRRYEDGSWHTGHTSYPATPDPSGAGSLLAVLQGGPSSYAEWARGYFEVPVDLDAVRRVYRHDTFDVPLVRTLNPEITPEELKGDVEEIGYGEP